ncbi:MAG: hypothetical protein HYT87_20100 [Nitrospirae bacterium]|nr:hypothetical protein [Nitrospirota bacterium]
MKTCGNPREISFRLGALAALPLLIASCGGGGGGGAKTVITQKCQPDIECTLKYEPEINGAKKLLFELSIPAGALEEAVEISIEKSDEEDPGLSAEATYKVLPESLKFVAGKKAGLILGYGEELDKLTEEQKLELALSEEGLRIGKRNLEGGFDLVKDSGPPRLDVDQITGEVTGPGEYAVVYNPLIFSVSPEVGRPTTVDPAGTKTDGTTITVSGLNFKADEGTLVVMFNKIPVTEDIKYADGKGDSEFTLILPELSAGKKEEDLKGALTITVTNSSGKKRTSNAVMWGFGTGFDAAVYDLSISKGKLAQPGSECTEAECFTQPWGIAVDQFDCIYVADSANHRIKKFTSSITPVSKDTACVAFDPTGSAPTFMIGKKGDPAVDDKGASTEIGKEPLFNTPLGLAVDVKGNIYVADSLNHRVVMLDKLGKVVALFGKYGTGTDKTTEKATEDELNQPSGIAVDPDGNLYVVDTLNNRIVYFKITTATTKNDKDIETTTTTAKQDTARKLGPTLGDAVGKATAINFLGEPSAVAYDSASTPHRIFFADPGNYRVVYFKRNADKKIDELDKAVGQPARTNEGKDDLFLKPVGVTVDIRSSIYVVDKLAARVQKFDRSVRALPSSVGNSKDRTQLSEPTTMVVDSKASLYVLDRALSKVQKFSPR